MRRSLLLTAALLAASGAPARGGIASDAGTRGSQFLRYEPGGRHAALGGTYAAYGNDAFSLWGQPAALADAGRINVALQHASLFQDVSQEYVGILLPFRGTRAAGVTVNYVDAGDLLRATEDATGNLASLGGNFEARDLAVGLHYGQNIGEKLSLGGAVRIIDSKIDDRSATGYAADLGLRYRVLPRLSVGASMTNLGHGLKFIRLRDDLPLTFRVGASYLHPLSGPRSLLFAGDVWKGPDTEWEFGGGVEARVVGPLALRIGYRSAGDDVGEGLTGGAGFRVGDPEGNHAEIDYAFVPFGELGEAHRVSLTLRWGPWRGGNPAAGSTSDEATPKPGRGARAKRSTASFDSPPVPK